MARRVAAADGRRATGGSASLADQLSLLLGEPTPIVGHDMAFAPAPSSPPGLVTGVLFVSDIVGNQSFAFSLSTGIRGTTEAASLDIEALASYYPMRQWAGKALISGIDGEAYYDLGDGWLPLTELPRPRYVPTGVIDRLIFDGRSRDVCGTG